MSITYRPEIDGLRAIAVLSVVLFHADLHYFSGGYVGVDIFFVLSGFLITSILLKDLQAGQFSILKFYERRARRIAPALILVTVLTMIAAFIVASPSEIVGVFESAAATALFIANFRFWQATGYFDTAAEERPLLHMWSLAVEEQFYIVFPFILLLLWRSRRDKLVLIFMIGAAISMAIAEIGWRTAPTANFFLPFSRFWELLAGSILAVQMQSRTPGEDRFAEPLAVTGLAMIILSIFAFDKFVPSPSLYLLLPVGGAYLVIRHAGPSSFVTRILSLRWVVGLGLISYSVYLYHQPLLAFSRIAMPASIRPDWLLPLMGLLSLPLGYLSWRFVEQPTRKYWSQKSIWTLTLAGFFGIAAAGTIAHLKPDLVRTVYVAGLNEVGQKNYDILEQAKISEIELTGSCRFREDGFDADFTKKFDACVAEHGPGIMLLGGSHAGDLHGVLASAYEHPFVFSVTKGYCRPHRRLVGPPPHPCQYDEARAFANQRSDDLALVVYTQAFFTLFDDYRNTQSTTGFHPELVDEAVAYLASLNTRTPVIIMGPRRTPGFHVPKALHAHKDLSAQARDLYNPGVALAEDLADQTFRETASSYGVPYISLIETLDQQLPDGIIIQGRPIYHDSDHLNAVGEQYVGRLLRENIAASETDAAKLLRMALSDTPSQ